MEQQDLKISPELEKTDYLKLLSSFPYLYENSANIKETVSKMLEKLIAAVGADAVVVFLEKSPGADLCFFEAFCESLGALSSEKYKLLNSMELNAHNSLTGKVFASGSVQYFNDLDKNASFNVSFAKPLNYDINNMLIVPMVHKSRPKGVLAVYNKYKGGESYSEEMIDFIKSAASYICLAVDDSSLSGQMSSHCEQMSVLINSMDLVNSNLCLDMVLDTLMPLAIKIINAEAASIVLVDEEKQKLCFVAASGKKKEEIKNVALNIGEGVAGWVAKNGAPLLIPDVSYDKRFSFKADQQTGFVTKSILAVPLKLSEKVIGVVEAVNKKNSGKFTNDDMKLLMTFASTGAMAIQKAKLYEDLNDLFMGTLRAIADAIEAKDPYTRGHSERIRRYSMLIAERLGLDDQQKRDLSLAALLHDVGKIGVPEDVLVKKEELTVEEWAAIRRHPSIGADMLSSIKQLKSALPGIRHHQERFDGQGYPSGLTGEDIPLFSRIIAVVDTFDSMNTDRPYRRKLPEDNAIDELKKYSGLQFDPDCVDAFLQIYSEKQA